jgi:hypothetical protein
VRGGGEGRDEEEGGQENNSDTNQQFPQTAHQTTQSFRMRFPQESSFIPYLAPLGHCAFITFFFFFFFFGWQYQRSFFFPLVRNFAKNADFKKGIFWLNIPLF